MQAVNFGLLVFLLFAILGSLILCMNYLIQVRNELQSKRTGEEPDNGNREFVRNWVLIMFASILLSALAMYLNFA